MTLTKKRISTYSTQSDSGFTLVELVIVIVILGIISIVAVPRFIELGSDAKRAGIKSLAAQIKASTELVQNKARASGLRPV